MGLFNWAMDKLGYERKGSRMGSGTAESGLATLSPREVYRIADAWYQNNRLYDNLAQILGTTSKAKALRNPAHRDVEFFAMHLWPGTLPDAMPVKSDNARLPDAVGKILAWSNWNANKQVAARWLPKYGDLFLKAVQTENKRRAYVQLIEPSHVTNFEKDERGFVVWIRLDVPLDTDGSNDGKRKTHTEVWDKAQGAYTAWEHDQASETDLDKLGTPKEQKPLSSMGIDFVPFTHAKFQDVGAKRGAPAFWYALEQIDELNSMATRLHSMFFRYGKALWALSRNEAGANAVSIEDLERVMEDGKDEGEEIELGDETFMTLPGLSTLESLVPELPYEAARNMLSDQYEEVENQLPELLYFVAKDKGDPSGRALRLKLAPATKRALEARGNGEAALIQAVQMALTLAKNAGLFGAEIGSFERGDFDFSFDERDVMPLSEEEKAEARKADLEGLQSLIRVFSQLGLDTEPLKKRAAEIAGVDPEELEDTVPADPDGGVDGISLDRARALVEAAIGGGGAADDTGGSEE